MSSWLSGMERNFAEKLDLCYFSFHAADFPTSAILNSFQELCHRTRRACSHGTATLAVDTMYLYMIHGHALLQPISISSLPVRPRALHCACCILCRTRGFVRGKSSDAVWPGLEAYRRWSPFLHLFALLSALDMMIASWSSLSSLLFCQFSEC